ncbi:MAG: MmgE/PrpD family protein [Chloroflexota bacterium]
MKESGHTQKIIEFVRKTQFEDIPADVVVQTKRVILDTVGCALSGFSTDKGRSSRKVAVTLGGNPESSILGTAETTSCLNAAFANANMANALDNDDCFRNLPHFSMHAVFAALSLGEKLGLSGKNVIAAVALGYDVAARVASIFGFPLNVKEDRVDYWRAYGLSWEVFAAVVAAAKMLDLDSDKMDDALGIAGTLTPVPMHRFLAAYPIPMVKYNDAGWTTSSGIMAALLAESGYTGPPGVLDPGYELWRVFGAEHYDYSVLTRDLGRAWQIMDSSFKPWPSCRWTHHPLTLFLGIVKENDLKPEEIEKVAVKGSFMNRAFDSADPTPGPIGPQFNIQHAIAAAALGIPAGPNWQKPEVIDDPLVKEFRRRVFLERGPRTLHGGRDDDVIRTICKELPGFFTRVPTTVEVTARGMTISKSGDYAKGDPWSPETRLSDQEVRDKFYLNAIEVLPNSSQWRGQIARAADIVFALEELDCVSDLTGLLAAR